LFKAPGQARSGRVAELHAGPDSIAANRCQARCSVAKFANGLLV
jgi:hypothetical protein